MTTLTRRFAVDFEYHVAFTRGLFDLNNPRLAATLADLQGDRGGRARCCVVIDSGVVQHHPALIKRLQHYATASESIELVGEALVIEGGETCKNDSDALKAVLTHLDRQAIDRQSYVIAIGSGALLDMVGFAAGICHRGVRLIRVPSTVLSQNDSGVGVKNSFNLFGKKNFLGTFAPPHAVLNDLDLLTSLSQRDWLAGTAEAVKVALLKDPAFFAWLTATGPAIRERDLEAMAELVRVCAGHHMDHIAGHGDPFERASSRPLDFGHWAAHKLEQLTNFELRHGEAVAIGIALDVGYSQLVGLLPRTDAESIWQCLAGLGLPLDHPQLRLPDGRLAPEILAGLQEFREHLGGELTIMLLRGIGHGHEVHEMQPDLIERAAGQLKQLGLNQT